MGCAGLPIGATSFQSTETTTDATTPLIVKPLVSSKIINLTDITISTDTEMTIEIQDTDGTVISQQMYFPANSIWSKTWSISLVFPISKGVQVVASVAGNVSVTITGYLT
jgi:hypothetical protein